MKTTGAAEIQLNQSWMNGKYNNGEVDWSYSIVSINEPELFLQGDDADSAIEDMHQYWLKNDCSTEDAFNWWVNTFL